MDSKTVLVIKYYLSNGDRKPSEILDIPLESCCYCPTCRGEGQIYQQSSDGRDNRWITCKTCQGFGVFDHQPKPITRVIGYE